MGFFNFLSGAGKNLLGSGDDAAAIKTEIEDSFAELPIQGLVVEVNGEFVTLGGRSNRRGYQRKIHPHSR